MNACPHLNRPRDGYVFIVTYGRSGSTLLQSVLNGIPGYCIRGENNNALVPLVASWRALIESEPLGGWRKAAIVSPPDDPHYGAELIRPSAYGRALADLFVRDILNLPDETRVGGFKEIRFFVDPAMFRPTMRFLHEFFPRARIVFNTRDHAAVARSGWWARMDPARVSAQLKGAETLFDSYLDAHPDRAIRLCYDDYNGNPEGLRPLFDFLGEPFDAGRVAARLAQRLTHPGTKPAMNRPQGGNAAAKKC
jgi:hypothetical protein